MEQALRSDIFPLSMLPARSVTVFRNAWGVSMCCCTPTDEQVQHSKPDDESETAGLSECLHRRRPSQWSTRPLHNDTWCICQT